MMPVWLEYVLTPIVVYAILFLIAWLLARNRLSPCASILGWTAVVVTVISVLWSLWYESLLPYLRVRRWLAVVLTLMQLFVMISGVALMFYGAVRFLRAWLKFMMWKAPGVIPSLRKYVRGEHPYLEHIRSRPTLGERLTLVGKLILNLLMLPGLGWVFAGLGITIGGAQAFEPDPSITPDVRLIALAVIPIVVGGAQVWVAKCKEMRMMESMERQK